MPEDKPPATFNIGSQQGNISNVGGDMTVRGDQVYIAERQDDIHSELEKIRVALGTMELDPEAARTASQSMAETIQTVETHPTEQHAIAQSIARLTGLLKDVGALAAGGAEVIEPIRQIATWLGDAGQGILRLLT